ncbi:MarR family winged helix-turn-helix transcriptional regulator [Cognatishimia activa]|uniref:Multidrug resistance operon repressor n=1 Tax=Cognatishimia activa TaxID=1715691 RepID=A0A0P1IP99_9RHOB|nr:MarR family transcriptional regulator [Cognatishimia activa]CUJ23212.1 Multidrug resistance operon repressor [Cognatishimia activa]CUK25401.1 Multidrug resistance operon repressor [Cognatishimia activa]
MTTPDFALLVDRFMRQIHFGLQQSAADFDKRGVGPGGGIVLMTLKDTGEIKLNELTARVARDKSQISRLIRTLEGKGLVHRKPSQEDGRISLISLTESGEIVVSELMNAVADVINDILAPISSQETKDLEAILSKALADRRD